MLRTPVALCGGLLLAMIAAAPVLADELPLLKPGLWESKSTETSGSRLCTDATVSKKMMEMMTGDFLPIKCAKREIRKTADGYIYEKQCEAFGQSLSSQVEFIGDFNSSLTVKATVDGVTSPSMEIKWVGSCPADWKPGDTSMPDGSKLNMFNMFNGPPK